MDRITCSFCKREYRVSWAAFGMRDHDKEMCVCGKELYRWNGSRVPEFTLIEETSSQKGDPSAS